jgi:hypothetical protein
MMLNTPDQIHQFRRLTLLRGLKLEAEGFQVKRPPSCYTVVKKEFGLKGNKAKVLEQFTKIVNDMKGST